jgi:hypothetical protein
VTSGFSQPDNEPSVIEELTAYLDGELEQEALQKVEQRLVSDPSYLAEMQSLQKTWDLLDELPRTEPGVSFTQTTMEMVVGEATRDARKKQKRNWVWAVRAAVLLAVPIVLFATAFALTRNIQTGSDRLLVQDLSVIENYPKYLVVENSIAFLDELIQRDLFSDGSIYGHIENAIVVEMYDASEFENIPDSPEARKAYIAALNIEKKSELKKKLDDYSKLTDDEVKQFREFDKRLHAHERKVQLMSVMNAYYNWLKTINSGERARLMDLAIEERIDAISAIRDLQAREEFGRTDLPTVDDRDLVFRWSEGSFWLKEKQIREHFPAALAQIANDRKLRPPPPQLARRVAQNGTLPALVGYLLRYDRDFIEDLILQENDMNMLYRVLSPKAKTMLDERSQEEQRKLILTWIESANQSKNDVSWETLRKFEKTLSLQERDELDKLSTEGYHEALKAKYREKQKFQAQPGFDDGENWRSFFDFGSPPDTR